MEELADIGSLVAEHDTYDLPVAGRAVPGVERDQLGVLFTTRHAPTGDEVQHHPAPA
jgi:hypothetical protein